MCIRASAVCSRKRLLHIEWQRQVCVCACACRECVYVSVGVYTCECSNDNSTYVMQKIGVCVNVYVSECVWEGV